MLYRNSASEAGIAKQIATYIRGSPPSWEADGAATIGRWTEGRTGPRRLLEMRMSYEAWTADALISREKLFGISHCYLVLCYWQLNVTLGKTTTPENGSGGASHES